MAKPARQVELKPFLFERSFDGFGDNRQAIAAAGDQERAAAAKAKAESEEAATAAKQAEQEADAEPSEPEIEVVYTEDDLAAAKQEAYMNGHADGFREGHAEAMDTLEKTVADLLEAIGPKVTELGVLQTAANDRAQANMARIVKAMLAKLMPVYNAHHGAEETLAIVVECLNELQDVGRLTIRMSADNIDALGDKLSDAAQQAGFEGTVRMLAEEGLGPSDVRVEWGAGGVERRFDSNREQNFAAIDRMVERVEEKMAASDHDSDADIAQGPDGPAMHEGNPVMPEPAEEE